MTQSNRDAAACLMQHGVTACTDVTGFGLAGHLLEMATASEVDVELDIASVPLLEGAEETVTAGSSGLSFDPATGHYVYVWKTDRSWRGCRQLTVRLNDGMEYRASFQFD